MKKKKTEKFTICFEGADKLSSIDIELTKTQFYKHLETYRQAVNNVNNNEFYKELDTEIIKDKKMETLIYAFREYTSTIVLTHYKCKEGYCFK